MSFAYAFNHVIIVAEQTYIYVRINYVEAIIIRAYYMTIWSKFVSCVIIFDNDRLNWFIIHVNKISFHYCIIVIIICSMTIKWITVATAHYMHRTSDNITRRRKVQGHRPHQLVSPNAAPLSAAATAHTPTLKLCSFFFFFILFPAFVFSVSFIRSTICFVQHYKSIWFDWSKVFVAQRIDTLVIIEQKTWVSTQIIKSTWIGMLWAYLQWEQKKKCVYACVCDGSCIRSSDTARKWHEQVATMY